MAAWIGQAAGISQPARRRVSPGGFSYRLALKLPKMMLPNPLAQPHPAAAFSPPLPEVMSWYTLAGTWYGCGPATALGWCRLARTRRIGSSPGVGVPYKNIPFECPPRF
jgi:hypothetical protein